MSGRELAYQSIQELRRVTSPATGSLLPIYDPVTNKASSIDLADLLSGATISGIVTPEDWGCKGEFYASSGGVWDGTYFSDTNFDFTQEHVGWSFWQDGNLRTITAVTEDGKASLNPNGYGTQYINWRMMGQNDTVYFQRFLNSLSPDFDADNPDADIPEPVIGLNGALQYGKVGLLTPGVNYPVGNTSAQYSGGKLSALWQPRRTTVTCLSMGEHGSSICMIPGSYGHVISNRSTTSYSDFLQLFNITIVADGDFSTNSLDGVHWDLPYGNYDKVDPYHRIEKVRVERSRRHGYYFNGKGELKVRDCDAFNSGSYGMFITGQYDISVIGGQFGGCSKTGFRIDSPGPIQVTGIKSFYSGSGGGSNDEDCANIVLENLTGDAHSGGAFITNFQAQESRGCGIIIKIRNCQVYGQVQDPNRSTIGAASGRPTVKAGVYLKGPYACGNDLRIIVMAALTEYATPNWPADTCILAIDGDDPFSTTNGGPQNNYGEINYPVDFITPGNGTLKGVTFTGTGQALYDAAGQKGCVNGKNTRLLVNGVALT